MQDTKLYSIKHQQFLVNGTKCELSVDRECLSWMPINHGQRERNQPPVKKVSFAQVVGFIRWLPDELHYCIEAKETDGKGLERDIIEQKSSKSRIGRNFFACRKCDKIKVYYSKQNENSSSCQLLILKKLIIEPLIGANKSAKLQESGPPSCYASEDSSSHLSSISSSSSSSSQIATDGNSPPGSPAQNAATCFTEVALSSLPKAHWPSERPLESLAKQIETSLELIRKQRPRRLLVFVNPFGGKGCASQLYKSHVRRLFDIAGVQAKLVITKYANHARDTIEDPQFNVEFFDGIVCVGGDGMFSELMNGLLFRYNRDLILTAEHGRKADGEAREGDGGKDKPVNTIADGDKLTLESPAMDDRRHNEHDDSLNNCLSLPDNNNANENNDCDSFSDNNRSMMMPTNDRGINNNSQIQAQKQLVELRRALGGIGKPFVSPPIPIGVIGAGSTDANSFGLIGTNDVITATLNILLGHQIKIDVCSVHSIKEDRLLRFVSTFVAYGYFGDVIRESEKFRWLGPSRYDLTGANNLIKNRAYKGLVRILISGKDGTPFDLNRCHANCELCCLSTNNKSLRASIIRPKPPGDLELSFIEKRGHFIGVNAAITACRCPQTKKGFSPNNHLANGCADLILVRPCSRLQYIQYLMRTGWTKKSAFDLKYVEAYRCRQFEFVAEHQESQQKDCSSTSSSSSSSASIADQGSNYSSLDSKYSTGRLDGALGDTLSSWNVDGEILDEQSVRVKVNNQLLRVFGTGEPLLR